MLSQPHVIETRLLGRDRRPDRGRQHLVVGLSGGPRRQQEHPNPHGPTVAPRGDNRSVSGTTRAGLASLPVRVVGWLSDRAEPLSLPLNGLPG
jgi:hypothetical protein